MSNNEPIYNIKIKDDRIGFLCLFTVVKLKPLDVVNKVMEIDICISIISC